MTNQEFIQNIRNLIAADDLTKAVAGLKVFLANTPLLNELLQQSGRFENIRKQIRLGMVGHAEANLTQNQIRAGLLDLLLEIENRVEVTSSQPDRPALREEIERAISIVNSKNVIVGANISAQTLSIGDKTEVHHHYGQEKPNKSVWLKIGAALVTIIGLLAGIAGFTGVSLTDLWNKKSEAPIENLQEPAPAEQDMPPEQNPTTETDPKYQQPTVKTPKSTLRNNFESHDSSKQINIPDNQGTININQ